MEEALLPVEVTQLTVKLELKRGIRGRIKVLEEVPSIVKDEDSGRGTNKTRILDGGQGFQMIMASS